MPEQTAAAPTVTPVRPLRPLRRLAWVGIGAAAALVALLPWLVTGMRLPLQNLWAVQTLPADMPIALLPLSQYAVTLILSLLVVGYGVAGVAVRALRERLPNRGVLAVGAGVLVVHALVATQAATTVAGGLAQRTESAFYLAALLAVVMASVLTGLVVLWLVAGRARAGAVIGLTVLALAVVPWLTGVLAPLGTLPSDLASALLRLVDPWVVGVLVGVVLAWGGYATRGRVAAAVGSLLLLWVVPAAFTAVSAAAGSRVLLAYPEDMLEYGLGVLRAAMGDPELVLPRLLVAASVAAAGIALGRLRRRRSPGDT